MGAADIRNATITGEVLPLVARALAMASVDVARAFGDSGLGWCPARNDAVPLHQFVRLLQCAGARHDGAHRLWQSGRAMAGPSLEHVFPGTLGERRLGGLLRRLVAELDRVQGGSDFRLEVDGDLAILSYRIVDPAIWPRSRDAEFTLGFFDGVIGMVCGAERAPLETVAFEHGRDGCGDVGRLTGVGSIFGEPANLIAIPVQLLDVSVNPALAGSATRDGAASRQRSFDETVATAIYRRFGRGAVSEAEVAAACGLTERTLRRRLRAENLTFRGLLDNARADYARWALTATDLSIAEIARRLGYDGQSAFARAFKRQSGMPPSALRRHRAGSVQPPAAGKIW